MSNLTIIKTLPKAWKVSGQAVTEIEMREPTVRDLTEAEKEANPALSPHAFSVALACQTMVRAGTTFTGPFAPGMFASMGAKNWAVVRGAMAEAEELGEA